MSGPDRYEEFREIRDLLAGAPAVEPRPGVLERIIAEVAAAPDRADRSPRSAVVDLAERRTARSHRWAPRMAAAAVVIAIVGVVVGGVGADPRLPAIGDLVESHQAAAAEGTPPAAREMPMDEAHTIEPPMPRSMKMTAAFEEADDTVHLVYVGPGGVVSVFRQVGDADLADMGDDGDIEMMGETPVWVTVVAEVHVAVVDGDGYVWTVVADHHDDAMMAAMTDDLPTRSPSVMDRVRDVADAIADPWRLGT